MLPANRVAIVTGGARSDGLGLFTVRMMMTEQGARVAIMDMEGANPDKSAGLLGEGHLGVVGDVNGEMLIH